MSCEPFIRRNRPPDSLGLMVLQGLTAILAGLREQPGTFHHHILLKRTKTMTLTKGGDFECRSPKPFSEKPTLGSAASQVHVAQREARQKEWTGSPG